MCVCSVEQVNTCCSQQIEKSPVNFNLTFLISSSSSKYSVYANCITTNKTAVSFLQTHVPNCVRVHLPSGGHIVFWKSRHQPSGWMSDDRTLHQKSCVVASLPDRQLIGLSCSSSPHGTIIDATQYVPGGLRFATSTNMPLSNSL